MTNDVVVRVTLVQTGEITLTRGTPAFEPLAYKIGDGERADTSWVADDGQVHFKRIFTGVGRL